MKKIALVAFLALLSACTSAPGARPNKFNYPPSYLEHYPLGQTEEEAIAKLGPPDQIVTLGEKRMLVYHPGQVQAMSYSFIIENGVVSDVVYNESGSLNGKSAKKLQNR